MEAVRDEKSNQNGIKAETFDAESRATLFMDDSGIPTNEKEWEIWWQCYVHDVTSSAKKESIKTTEMFSRLHRNCPHKLSELFNDNVVVPLKEYGLVRETDFKFLSAILENQGQGRDVLWTLRGTIYDRLLTFVTLTLDGLDLGNNGVQAKLHACVRSILKMEQCYYQSWTVERKGKSLGELEQRVRLVLKSNVSCDNCEAETCLLAATAYGFFLHSFCDPLKGLELFLSTFPLMGKLNAIADLDQKFGSLTANDLKSNAELTVGNSAVFFLHGLLACGKTSILLEASCSSDEPFVTTLIPVLVDLCGSPKQNAYHAFSTLAACLRFVVKNVEELRLVVGNGATKRVLDRATRTNLVDMLNFNWNNPIVGVTGFVREAFRFLVEIHCAELRLSPEIRRLDESYVDELCSQIMCQPWTAKSKYPPLAILVPYVGLRKLLSKYPSVVEDLSESLSSNSISSVGFEVYRALLQQFRKENASINDTDLMKLWREIFLKPLLLALYQKNRISHRNAIRHMLAPTLKLFPLAFEEIWLQINADQCRLALLVTVLRLARGYGIRSLSATDIQVLKRCLNSADEEIREDAFAAVCTCSKKAEPLSFDEMDLLKDFLAGNLNVDCASFRQQLICNFKVMLVRLRNSCLSWISIAKREGQSRREHDHLLCYSIDFLDYLFHLILNNLSPGGCYQRKQTCLLLLKSLLETFCANDSSTCRKKGVIPAKIPSLLEYFEREKKCAFLSARTRRVLLACILDFMDEIKDLSMHLLNGYFDRDVAVSPSREETERDLFRWALRLCRSPKATLCQSGARLVQYMFRRSEVPQRLFLIHSLKTELRKHYACAKENLLQASKCSPMHGLLSALSRLFGDGELSTKDCDFRDALKTALGECVHAACDIVDHVLSVLGVNADSANAPSFEDMGAAIDDIVMASRTDGSDPPAYSSNSFEHQLVQSCCWLSLKEGCLFLGNVVNSLPLEGSCSGEAFLVSREDVKRAGETLVSVLLTCRHRGAIEACSVGFESFCKSLIRSCDAAYVSAVHDTLSDALEDVASPATLTSVTRRSAGLPLLIQTVASSEPLGQQKFLSESMRVLLETAEVPLPEDFNEMVDLPQTRALHILRALIHDCRFSQVILPFLDEVVIVCLDSFLSPSWAVRNAGLQLFGSLVPRLLGQKKVSEDESGHNRIACNEFFARWPRLREFLTSELGKADPDNLRPSILPILSLLGRLAPDAKTNGAARQMESSAVARAILPLLGCPIWHVRRMAARDIASLSTEDCRAGCFRDVCKLLATRRGGANSVHGHLLLLKALLENDDPRLLGECARENYRVGLADCFGVFPALAECPILQMAMMDVLLAAPLDCIPSRPLAASPDFLSFEPGHSLWTRKMTYWRLLLCPGEDVVSLVSGWLDCDGPAGLDVDECEACLRYLREVLDEGNSSGSFWIRIQNMLCPLLARIGLPALLLKCQQLMTDICTRFHAFPDAIHSESLLAFSVRMASGEYGSSVRAVSAVFWAIAIAIKLPQEFPDMTEDCVEPWTSLVRRNASPELSELSRMSAAKALDLCGCQLLESVAELDLARLPQNVESCILRIFDATMLLLQDEQTDIRKETSKFVSALAKGVADRNVECVHSNLAIEYLGSYFARRFHASKGLGEFIWEKFSCASQLEAAMSDWADEDSKSVALFEQEDINVYAEKCFMTRCYVDILKGMIAANGETHREIFDYRRVAGIARSADSVNAWLESQRKHGIGVLEIVTRTKIVSHLCNLSAQLEVLLSSELGSSERSRLTREHEKLRGVVGFTWR